VSVYPRQDDGPLVFDTPEEAVECFKRMLKDCGISSTSKWHDVQKTCQKERRWAVLRTTGERKQVRVCM
jgi:hypothetical protein